MSKPGKITLCAWFTAYIVLTTLYFLFASHFSVYWNRFGEDKVYQAEVDPDEGDPLEYTITGLDPQDPLAAPDPSDPEERPAAYSVWVICICEATFTPPEDARKKRQAGGNLNVQEEDFVVESEPSILDHDQGLTGKKNTKRELCGK